MVEGSAAKLATTVALHTGEKMPTVGLGLWKMPNDKCADAVYNSIKSGYRLLDSACDYGNEQQTGQGIKKAIDEKIVERKDLFVVSKLWNTFHKPENVKLACKKSMEDLGVDYLDLYLIHFPIAQKFIPIDELYPPEWVNMGTEDGVPRIVLDTTVTYQQTYEAMEKLVDEGLVKAIGVCNIGTCMLQQVLNYSRIKPAVLQVEMHPLLTQQKLLRFAREAGLQTMAFSCFGSTSYVEIGGAKPEESLMNYDLIKGIAAKLSKTEAQVLLRWGVQRGTIVIPKSVDPGRQAQNIGVFDFEISEDDMKAIDGLDKNKRYNDPGVFAEAAFGKFVPIYE